MTTGTSIELPTGYYLDNFRRLLDTVVARYDDLLTDADTDFIHRFDRLDLGAARLLVRLYTRKGPYFRLDKLNYPEIGDPVPVTRQLADQGLVDPAPELTPGEIARLLTLPELRCLDWVPDPRRSKSVLLAELDTLTETGAPDAWGVTEAILAPCHWLTLRRLQLMYFGNEYQSLTDFVLSDLGLFQYEAYSLDRSRRWFNDRLEIEQQLHLNDLKTAFYEAQEAGDARQLDDLADRLLAGDWCDAVAERHARLCNRLGFRLEQLGALDRALAEFCLDSGDLVSTFRATPSALEGRETHGLTQRRRPEGYRAEVAVETRWQHPDFDLVLAGRLDGVWPGGIEEIKTCRVPPEELPESARALNRMQARLYAALWAMAETDLTECRVRLCYVHSQTQREWLEDETWSRPELLDLLVGLLGRYEHWLARIERHRRQRDTALKRLAFPFAGMRAVQRDMAETVYKAQATGRQTLIEAPTGTGKTLAALFPALKAMARGFHQGLYYLTMKTTGQPLVLDTVRALNLAHSDLHLVNLQARERLCLSPDTPCDGAACPYARDYYRKRRHLRERLFSRAVWDRDALTKLGEAEQICPYYLSQDWALWADVVVGDINYLYDTTAVQPYLLKEIDNRVAVLIDESHNLIDRGRHMFSAVFDGETLEALDRQAPQQVRTSLRPVRRALKACQPEHAGLSDTPPDALLNALRAWLPDTARLLRDCPFWEPPASWQTLLFEAGRFVRINELAAAEDFCWRYQSGAPGERRVEVLCLNPARLLRQKHDLVNSVAAYSATLSPWPYSRAMTGLSSAVPRALPSPFAGDQFRVTLVGDVSTRFRDRDTLADQVIPLIEAFRRHTPGNALVFFSSYQQMARCGPAFQTDPSVIIQQRRSTLLERLALLDRLRTERGLTVLAPLGGVMGEGIDLPGDALSGVMVVGPGLPQVNPLNDRIRQSLDRGGLPGFDFAYRFPGLHKVLQAAGRCVRTETDRGDIWLVDDRFVDYHRAGWLPAHWQVRAVTRAQLLS